MFNRGGLGQLAVQRVRSFRFLSLVRLESLASRGRGTLGAGLLGLLGVCERIRNQSAPRSTIISPCPGLIES